jgi:hypothetical protein
MKVKILVGSNFPINKKEVRAEAGEVLELPDKVAKALIKNNAAVKFDSKMMKEEDGTATRSGYFESSSPDADAEYLAQLGGTGAAFSIAPIGYTRGNSVSFGTTIETSYDRSADVGSVVAVAVAFQFSGDAHNGKSLLTPTAVTSSSNQTSVDFGAAGTNGGAGVLHCTVSSGSPTLDVKIQTSADNASFSDYITFTQATGTTSELKTSASNPARYARAVLTFGGSGSITAAVGFAQG